MRAVRGAGPLALVLLTAACGGDGGGATTSGGTQPADAPAAPIEELLPGGEPRVEVIDAGAEPRRPLRLDLHAGDEVSSSLTFQLGIDLEVDGEPFGEMPMPAVRAGLRVSVVDVTDDAITATFGYEGTEVVDDGSLPPEALERARAELAGFDRVTGTFRFGDRGQSLGGAFDVPDDLPANAAQMIDQLSGQLDQLAVPFPEEEVGEGARWIVHQMTELSGITTTQAITYTLRSLEGDEYVLDLVFEQRADPQPADLPGVDPSVEIDLRSYELDGDGVVEGSLASILPVRSEVRSSGTMVLDHRQDGQEGTIVQRLTLGVVLERR